MIKGRDLAMMNVSYKVSVIMAIYNTEQYLRDAIDSIIGQTVGFEQNIQLILINDGSTDGCGSICEEYVQKYPKNIIYKEKENGGASSARNEGRKYAKGKYINFFDSDDKWSLDAFERVLDFFDKNYDAVDVVSCRLYMFDKREGFTHSLDYKYDKGDRVVDLENEYTCAQLMNGNVFFKSEAIEGLYYNTEIKTSEDTLFIGQVMLKKKRLGVMRSAVYYYRKRYSGESLSDQRFHDKSGYTEVIKNSFSQLFECAQDENGQIPKFIQYVVMYDIQWRMPSANTKKVLDDEEMQEYLIELKGLLQQVDDEIIYFLKNCALAYQLFLYKIKYGKDIIPDAQVKKKRIIYNGKKIVNLQAKKHCNVQIIEIKNSCLVIEGVTEFHLLKGYRLYLRTNLNENLPVEMIPFSHEDRFAFTGEQVQQGMRFHVEVPLNEIKWVRLVTINEAGVRTVVRPGFGRLAPLTNQMEHSYCVKKEGYILKWIDYKIKIYHYKRKTHFRSEVRYLKELIQDEKKGGLAAYRILYYLAKLFVHAPVWLVRDRFETARDNGESVFRYLCHWSERKNYHIYYLLNKDSEDFARVRAMGKIIPFGTIKYKLFFLMSSKIIDSIATKDSINAFDKDGKYMRNLYRFDYVFLGHGIAQRDMSEWTNKTNYNMKLHITGVEREYKAVLSEDNGYDESVVKLTGLPRYDNLIDKKERRILFLPTWRANIAGRVIQGTTEREYVDNFKETEYFAFYNALINDARILEIMKEKGYKGFFYNHPSFKAQYMDFDSNDVIQVPEEIANANEEIMRAAMLVTDYSSAAFECAYLRKPVIYCQFDSEQLPNTHTGRNGYFDYEKDSFGPVFFDYDSAVQGIVNMIKQDCQMDALYERRAETFFTFHDQKNAKRVVEYVMDLDKENSDNQENPVL